MSNVGNSYSRQIKTIMQEATEIGGIASGFFIFLVIVELFFGPPFRQLDLGISFQTLKEIHSDAFNEDELRKSKHYASRLTVWFYIKFFCYRTFPLCFDNCCQKNAKLAKDWNRSWDDPTFQEVITYYEELINQ